MSQNPYQTPADYGTNYGSAALASEDARASFIRKTYLHLLGAILTCVAIDALILNLFDAQLQQIVPMLTGGFTWLIVLGAFMAVSYVADRWARSDVSQSQQYLGLGLYVLAESLILIPLLYMAEHYGPRGVIQSAGLVTAVVFGGLTLTVLLTKADFSFLRWAIVAGTVIAFGLIIVAVVFPGTVHLGFWFSAAMVVLAMGIILYNTSNVLHHYGTHQHVAASLSLFASVALLFWYVLQIFMSFRD